MKISTQLYFNENLNIWKLKFPMEFQILTRIDMNHKEPKGFSILFANNTPILSISLLIKYVKISNPSYLP